MSGKKQQRTTGRYQNGQYVQETEGRDLDTEKLIEGDLKEKKFTAGAVAGAKPATGASPAPAGMPKQADYGTFAEYAEAMRKFNQRRRDASDQAASLASRNK